MEPSTSKPGVVIRTLGCKSNSYDSQRMAERLEQEGYEWVDESSDSAGDVRLCIVNSCSVTAEADRQSKKMVQSLKKRYPNAKTVFTGCAAEIKPSRFSQTHSLDYIVGNRDKYRIAALLQDETKHNSSGVKILGSVEDTRGFLSQHAMDREWPSGQEVFLQHAEQAFEVGGTRAFLKVQEGCNAFCTYCIIPYGRGPSRSLEPDRVVEQVSALVTKGYREIVLTGTDLGHYGKKERGLALASLAKRILAETAIERLRLSSLDPTEISDELLNVLRLYPERFCPHFHLAMQSPVTTVLRRMKRGYGTQEIEAFFQRIERLRAEVEAIHPEGFFIGADVITGFPGETEALFEEGLALLKRWPWTRLHVFPYSEREETPATRLDGQVDFRHRKARAKILQELSLERLKGHYRDVLEKKLPLKILLEKPRRGPYGKEPWWNGYTSAYTRVFLEPSSESPWTRNTTLMVAPYEMVTDPSVQDCVLVARARS